MSLKIAIITPVHKYDYLTDTVFDGLQSLIAEGDDLEFRLPVGYSGRLDLANYALPQAEFLAYAGVADLILLFWGKDNTNRELAEAINRFDHTIFIDGSEVGGNRRYDPEVQKQLLAGTYSGNGRVDQELLSKCTLYFKREKPYLPGIIPFPFGIETRQIAYHEGVEKNIDFVCIFGQEDYPPLRREVREALEEFCRLNDFSCRTKKTASPKEFYDLLAQAKVGVSVGGGGYDTARFWEILGNNCLLLTETIDIYESDSKRLDYDRIWQFSNLSKFNEQLEKMGTYLRSNYKQAELAVEYQTVLDQHSTKARASELITEARKKGIIV